MTASTSTVHALPPPFQDSDSHNRKAVRGETRTAQMQNTLQWKQLPAAFTATVRASTLQGGVTALCGAFLFDAACSDLRGMSPSCCGSSPYPCRSLAYRNYSVDTHTIAICRDFVKDETEKGLLHEQQPPIAGCFAALIFSLSAVRSASVRFPHFPAPAHR